MGLLIFIMTLGSGCLKKTNRSWRVMMKLLLWFLRPKMPQRLENPRITRLLIILGTLLLYLLLCKKLILACLLKMALLSFHPLQMLYPPLLLLLLKQYLHLLLPLLVRFQSLQKEDLLLRHRQVIMQPLLQLLTTSREDSL